MSGKEGRKEERGMRGGKRGLWQGRWDKERERERERERKGGEGERSRERAHDSWFTRSYAPVCSARRHMYLKWSCDPGTSDLRVSARSCSGGKRKKGC